MDDLVFKFKDDISSLTKLNSEDVDVEVTGITFTFDISNVEIIPSNLISRIRDYYMDRIYSLNDEYYMVNIHDVKMLSTGGIFPDRKLTVSFNLYLIPHVVTYFDIIPKDIMIFLMTKLELSNIGFRSMYPQVSSVDILYQAKLPGNIIDEFNKIKLKYGHRKIFDNFDELGLITAYNSEEADMFKLEELYPYFKVWSLWSVIIISNGQSRTIVNDPPQNDYSRYLLKIHYNDIYVRMNSTLMKLLGGEYHTIKGGTNWIVLYHDLLKFDKLHGIHNYTVRAASKNAINDDTLSIGLLRATLPDEYSTLFTVLSLILGTMPRYDVMKRIPGAPGDFKVLDYTKINALYQDMK